MNQKMKTIILDTEIEILEVKDNVVTLTIKTYDAETEELRQYFGKFVCIAGDKIVLTSPAIKGEDKNEDFS